MQVSTFGGGHYMLMLVDDFTRFKQVFVLKAKSDAGARILSRFVEMEAKHGRKVRALRTDRGR
jgi:hypothetical protein